MTLGTSPTLQVQVFTGSVLSTFLPKQTWGFLKEGKAAHCSHYMLLLADKQEMGRGYLHGHWCVSISSLLRNGENVKKPVDCFVSVSQQPEERRDLYVINRLFFSFLHF